VASPLADHTTLRLGGPAARAVRADSERSIVEAVRAADRAGEPLFVLAGGSNVVVADEGFPGTVVLVRSRGTVHHEQDGRVLVTVEAGEPWDPFVAARVGEQLAGVECLSGIPGSVGASPIQNVGAYGQDVSETIASVRVYDRARDAVEDLPPEACGFSYRSSAFKRTPGRWVVLSVTLALDRDPLARPIRYAELARELGREIGDRPPLREVRDAVLALRRRKGMVIDSADPDSVSVGSFFTNPVLSADDFERLSRRVAERLGDELAPPRFPESDGRVKTSAAWLIERAGFSRGHGDPETVAISSKHTLALTNRGSGSATGLVQLAREIADGVARQFGVELQPEPVFVGHEWVPPEPGGDGLLPANGEPE
jgi:UDP-N-acetylmuramate dehydrogenase